MFQTVGIEIETGGISPSRFGDMLRDRGINGFKSTYDSSPNVDAEIVTCPFVPNVSGWRYLKRLCDAINSIGREELGSQDRLINSGCGLHVHASNAFLNDGVDLDDYNRQSIEAFGTHGSNYHTDHGQPFDFALLKDVVYRYARQQSVVSSMLANSRSNNRFCRPLLHISAIENASNLGNLTGVLEGIGDNGKFSAITTTTYTRGTIEFRQHQGTTDALKIQRWVQFILNMFTHSRENRLTSGSRTIVQETPVDPFRRNSRIGVQYAMMRTDSGATTRELMDSTGCSEQRVRAAVSEIRQRVGDNAVVTHTQQSNGARYGDGTDHTRYQVLKTVETQTTGMELLPENRRGVSSVWAGISDPCFEWWQDRISELH